MNIFSNNHLTIFKLLYKLFSEKRASPQNGTAINQIQELKGSPPAKKVVPRRVQTSTTTTTTVTTASNAQTVKSPLKGRNLHCHLLSKRGIEHMALVFNSTFNLVVL
jgi:hypothetical protein